MFFDMKDHDQLNPYITVKEALKLKSTQFDNQCDAVRFIEDKGIKARLVDNTGVAFYRALDLGVELEEEE